MNCFRYNFLHIFTFHSNRINFRTNSRISHPSG
nr:MAG TPA: hypothetical protein [Caudoviricetes sp.]